MMSKQLKIEGRVQGVGYRASFAEQAVALGLSGWVRNRRDGSVEAAVDGDARTIEAIITWAKRGPPAARVSNVTVEESGTQASPDGSFKILPTQS
jgi:acylphosphatase